MFLVLQNLHPQEILIPFAGGDMDFSGVAH